MHAIQSGFRIGRASLSSPDVAGAPAKRPHRDHPARAKQSV